MVCSENVFGPVAYSFLLSSPHENAPTRSSVDILFLDFDAQEHHALAAHPVLHVRDVDSFLPLLDTVTIDIAGDTACLVILDALHIYDWKRGTARMVRIPPSCEIP